MDLAALLAAIEPWNGHFGFQVGMAVLCGGIVGIERQARRKAIGIRTAILICLATQVFIHLSRVLVEPGSAADATRVLGQVVTGVGFLGAGVILSKGGAVHGVTSAAVVWMLAAIGSSIGVGRGFEALLLSLLVVFILIGVRRLEQVFKRLGEDSDEPESTPGEDPTQAAS
ncbi:MAG: MgtC/SapB family protein [Spirochaetaceae bacterium]|nr:MgtC/SapB family protein [Myxococcales bacterium]MCB9724587.1 MgtC/SapB family protein [Spirochaetaceae bacterium]